VKERILFIGLVIAFVLAVPAFYYLLFMRELTAPNYRRVLPRAPRSLVVQIQPPSREVPIAFSLNEVSGKVEVAHGRGAFATAEVGLVLSAEDRIRTDATARAVMSMPGLFAIELDAGSEFQVKSLAQGVARFLLEQGMMAADVIERRDRWLEVAASSALARTRGAYFRLSHDQDGLVALATVRGSVEVSAAGRVIQVKEGYSTRVQKNRPPADPLPTPSQLLLRVRWPEQSALSSDEVPVDGYTAPGARVRVDGAAVMVDSQGHFYKMVSLKAGKHRIRIESMDVGGNRSAAESPAATK